MENARVQQQHVAFATERQIDEDQRASSPALNPSQFLRGTPEDYAAAPLVGRVSSPISFSDSSSLGGEIDDTLPDRLRESNYESAQPPEYEEAFTPFRILRIPTFNHEIAAVEQAPVRLREISVSDDELSDAASDVIVAPPIPDAVGHWLSVAQRTNSHRSMLARS